VGGAVVMNAGAHNSCIADMLVSAELLSPDGTLETLTSWGGANSLAVPYRMMQIRREWPHQGQLVRFNVGLEDSQELIDDLNQAFERLQ
ncbi:MAG: PLP-dependent transferase, partial [Burkholderiaceae bacterium]